MAEALNVVVRDQLGSRNTRRLRKAGKIPAVLYGHGEQNVNLALPASEVSAAIRHGAKLLDIRGAVSESVLIREVQWDAFGIAVLHLDLTRVSADESVHVTLPVELRGEAPGTKEGGIVEHVIHELTIECPVRSLPERLEVSVKELHLGQSITAGQVPLPAGAKLLQSAELVIVHCVAPAGELEEVALPGAEAAEPEIIGRKRAEEEEEGSGE